MPGARGTRGGRGCPQKRSGGREIEKLWLKVQEKGFTIVPTKLYFKANRVKLEIALAKGKDSQDKRQTIKKREADLEMRRALRRG